MSDGVSHDPLSYQQVFDLLLKARDGELDPSIPVKHSASPLERDMPRFFVDPTHKGKKTRITDGISVRYSNIARSKLWWSSEHGNLLGVVARKMGRKERTEKNAKLSLPAERHGLTGHWVSFIKRDSVEVIKDKAVARDYTVAGVPSYVEVWKVGGNTSESKETVEKWDQNSFELVELVSGSIEEEPPLAILDSSLTSAFNDLGVEGSYYDDLEIPVLECITRRHSLDTEELPGNMDLFLKIEEDSREVRFHKRTCNDHQPRVSDASEPEDHDSNSSFSLKSSTSEVSNLDASLYVHTFFKTVCTTFDSSEFKKWYTQYAKDVFYPDFAKVLMRCIEEKDPRVDSSFLFQPAGGTLAFAADKPIGWAYYTGNYGSGFEVIECDEVFQDIFGGETRNQRDIYENCVDSRIVMMCLHMRFKQLVHDGVIDPHTYWFHQMFRNPFNGRRAVFRGFTSWPDPDTNEVKHLHLQNVSDEYRHLLDMPCLPY